MSCFSIALLLKFTPSSLQDCWIRVSSSSALTKNKNHASRCSKQLVESENPPTSILYCTFYLIAHLTPCFILLFVPIFILTYIYIYILLCFSLYVSLLFFFLHFPLSGPVLTYISLLIIPCMIVYVTNNKEPWTLNMSVLHFLCVDQLKSSREISYLVKSTLRLFICSSFWLMTVSESSMRAFFVSIIWL